MHVNVIQFGFDHVKIAIQIYFDDIPIVGPTHVQINNYTFCRINWRVPRVLLFFFTIYFSFIIIISSLIVILSHVHAIETMRTERNKKEIATEIYRQNDVIII